jgi:hypothetical protein
VSDPFDDRLRDELSRRSTAADAGHGRDWARRELLPGVREAIETRPQRVTTSRAPALGGLLAAAAALVVLVVLLPRLTTGPASPTDIPASGAPTSVAVAPSTQPLPSPDAGSVTILSADAFQAGVADGTLLGTVVVVDATLQPATVVGPCPSRFEPCTVGTIAGSQRELPVVASWVRTVEGEGAVADVPEGQWKWWTQPFPDGDSPLVLRVSPEGAVEYLGQAAGLENGRALTVEQADHNDPNDRPLNEVYIVDAWLNETEPPGRQVIIDCYGGPDHNRLPGLPSRFCQPSDSLTDETRQGRVITSPGPAGIAVQRNAGQLFGRRELSSHGLFAIAPRLYGGCSTPEPCWQWDVIARLDPAPPQEGIARTLECGVVTVKDTSGRISSCQDGGIIDYHTVNRFVLNPDGDTTKLRIQWIGDPCVTQVEAVISRSGAFFEVVLVPIRSESGLRCSFPEARTFDLLLSAPIGASEVHFFLNEPELPPTPSPSPTTTPTPNPIPTPGLGIIPCTGDLPNVAITDYVGEVESCSVEASPDEFPHAGAIVTNPDDDLTRLDIMWFSSCVVDVRLDFQATTDGTQDRYDLLLNETQTRCGVPGTARILRIQLNRDVPAEIVQVGVSTPIASPVPQEFECPTVAQNIVLADFTGQLTACEAVPVDDIRSQIRRGISFATPTGDERRVRFAWTLSSCVSASASLEYDFGDFVLTIDERQPSEPCAGVPTEAGFEMVLDPFVNPSAFRLARTESTAPPPATPRPSVPPREIVCDRDGELRVIDTSGTVLSCIPSVIQQIDLSFSPIFQSVVSEAPSTIRIGWIGSGCETDMRAQVDAPGGHPVVTLEYEEPDGCEPVSTPYAFDIAFDHEVAPNSVTLVRGGSPASSDTAETDQGIFTFGLSASRTHYDQGEPIDVDAFLVWRGTDLGNVIEVSGPFGDDTGDLIGFGFEQIDGDLAVSPTWRTSCNSYQLLANEPVSKPYSKSGAVADDTNSGFWHDYFSDPNLTLPAGTYRIFAAANFQLDGACISSQVRLSASIVIEVE